MKFKFILPIIILIIIGCKQNANQENEIIKEITKLKTNKITIKKTSPTNELVLSSTKASHAIEGMSLILLCI